MFFHTHGKFRSLFIGSAVTLALVASGCSSGARTAANNAGRMWSSQAKNVSGPLKSWQMGDDTLRTTKAGTISKTLDETPTPKQLKKMSPEVRAEYDAALVRLRAEHTFYLELNKTLSTMSQRRTSAIAEAGTLVEASRREILTQDVRTHLVNKTREFLHEVACELAWTYMTEPERTAVNAELSSNTTELTYGNVVQNVPDQSTEKFINALASAGKSTLVNGNQTLAWRLYGEGLLEKADGLTKDGASLLDSPDEVDFTYGLLYFAGGCLKPPGS